MAFWEQTQAEPQRWHKAGALRPEPMSHVSHARRGQGAVVSCRRNSVFGFSDVGFDRISCWLSPVEFQFWIALHWCWLQRIQLAPGFVSLAGEIAHGSR